MKKYVWMLMTLCLAGVAEARFGNPAMYVTDEERNAEYETLYNSDAVAHEVGDVVVYKDGTYDGLEISSTTSAGNKLVAGIIALRDCPATSWCTVQVSGYHAAITVDVATAAGDALSTSTTAEAATVDNTAGPDQFAICLEATTSSTTVKGILLGR